MGAWAPWVSVAMPLLNSVELGEVCLETVNELHRIDCFDRHVDVLQSRASVDLAT